jgi:hypothetical protein
MEDDTKQGQNKDISIGEKPESNGTGKDPITGKFLPGNKLSPGGTKGRKLLSTLLREALEKQSDIEYDGRKVTYQEAVVWNLIRIATKGQEDKDIIKGIAEVFDRDEGKARGSLNIGLEREIEGVDITIVHANKDDIDTSVPKEPGEQGEDNT